MAKSKKASKGAIFAVVVSLITAAALIMGILTDWYTNFRKYLPKNTGSGAQTTADTLYAPDAGLLISQSTSDGIALYSMATPIADFETYSLDENAEAVQTITAQFTPADTTLQKVDYTAAWKNSASPWAENKAVSDYITLTQSSDGSLDCAVSLLDAIGEQIIITCTARPLIDGDWVPSATCTVDYYRRATGCTAFIEGKIYIDDPEEGQYTDTVYSCWLNPNFTAKYADEYAYTNASNEEAINSVRITPTYGIGTVTDSHNASTSNITVRISDSVAAKIKSAAGVSTLKTYTLISGGVNNNGYKMKTAIDTILGGASNVSSHKNAIYTAFKEIYDKNQAALTIEISYTTQQTKIDYTFTLEILFNPLALGVKASGLELDKPGIVFSLQYIPEETYTPEFNF